MQSSLQEEILIMIPLDLLIIFYGKIQMFKGFNEPKKRQKENKLQKKGKKTKFKKRRNKRNKKSAQKRGQLESFPLLSYARRKPKKQNKERKGTCITIGKHQPSECVMGEAFPGTSGVRSIQDSLSSSSPSGIEESSYCLDQLLRNTNNCLFFE